MFVWMHGFPPTFKPQLSHFPTAPQNRHTLHVHMGVWGVSRACFGRKTRSAKLKHAATKCYTLSVSVSWAMATEPRTPITPGLCQAAAHGTQMNPCREGSSTHWGLGSSQALSLHWPGWFHSFSVRCRSSLQRNTSWTLLSCRLTSKPQLNWLTH